MPTEDAVRWNVKVSKDTDVSLRTYLGARGMKKGDLSKFVEQAVLKQVFHRTIEDIHSRNRHTDPAVIEAEIDAAVREVRTEARRGSRTARRKP
jgi:hypothetical protein